MQRIMSTPKGEPILRATRLRKAFGGNVVLNGVDLKLQGGEVVLLRGANGSGKTTLLNILTGNLEPDDGVIQLAVTKTQEIFAFPRPWWRSINPLDHFAPERLARQGIGRSWQEIRLFSTQSLRDNIAVADSQQTGENPLWAILRPGVVRRNEKRVLSEADGVLADLGLGGRETSSADMVSLGQAKRVAIARAVRAGAKVLFLDEPLAGLDAQGVVSVITMLRDLAHDHQLTLVIVEHIFNIPLILDFATTVWTLKDGKLRVEDPQTVRSEVENQVGDGLLRWMREVAGSDGEIIETPLQSGAILMRVISSSNNKVSAEGRDVVLKVKDLVVRRGKRLVIGDIGQDGVVRGLSFELRRGELLVLQAPNGWGKTTLLEAIAGLVPSSKGSIELLGRPIESVTSWERRRLGLSLLRARDHTFPDLTVREALRLTGVRDVPGNLKHLLDRKCSDLSGGEKQRVALVSALNHKDLRVVLMDEPFSALDIDALHSTWATMKDCLAKAAIVVAIPGKHKALNNTTHI